MTDVLKDIEPMTAHPKSSQAPEDAPETETPDTEVVGSPASVQSPTEGPSGDLQQRYDELHNQYLRLAADFENFRKRQIQEREQLYKYGAQTTLEALLPVLDNLARAQKSFTETSDSKQLYKSFELLAHQLFETLKPLGLSQMAPQGELFDPALHEAVHRVENRDVPDNTILDVYEEGYSLYDKVLRPAKVVVSIASGESSDVTTTGGFTPDNVGDRQNPFQQSAS